MDAAASTISAPTLAGSSRFIDRNRILRVGHCFSKAAKFHLAGQLDAYIGPNGTLSRRVGGGRRVARAESRSDPSQAVCSPTNRAPLAGAQTLMHSTFGPPVSLTPQVGRRPNLAPATRLGPLDTSGRFAGGQFSVCPLNQ